MGTDEEIKELAKDLGNGFAEQLNDLTMSDSPSEFPDFALRCIKEGIRIAREKIVSKPSSYKVVEKVVEELKLLDKVCFTDEDFPEEEEEE